MLRLPSVRCVTARIEMADSMSRFARSWLLIKASMEVLRTDNALLILPAISGVMTMLVAGGFVALAVSDGTFAAMAARVNSEGHQISSK